MQTGIQRHARQRRSGPARSAAEWRSKTLHRLFRRSRGRGELGGWGCVCSLAAVGVVWAAPAQTIASFRDLRAEARGAG
jgi:hypothetical protein